MEGDLVRVEDLTKTFARGRRSLLGKEAKFAAVDHVTLNIVTKKTTAVVGETGSGKTTLGETVLLLTRPDSGAVLYDGTDITRLNSRELKAARQGMQLVFQDPFSSLDPRMSVKAILGEATPESHRDGTGMDEEGTTKVLRSVGLGADALVKFPHQFSTGQRQRIAIARALMSSPRFIVLDEPTSALDLSIQLQVLNLLRDLQAEFGITYMFITHNLVVAKYMSHYIAVMFAGRIVEYGTAHDVIENPKHPYTGALLSAVPAIGGGRKEVLQEKVQDALVAHSGCRYRLRCPFATEKCEEEPALEDAGNGHVVRCHYYRELDL
jgi:oligopeptide/dipeptide ABC transporter ATP-binding protein